MVTDRRPGLEKADYVFDAIESEIYLACDSGVTPLSIHRSLQATREDVPRVEEIRGFLDGLVASRLMYQEEDRYLSLAIAANGRVRIPQSTESAHDSTRREGGTVARPRLANCAKTPPGTCFSSPYRRCPKSGFFEENTRSLTEGEPMAMKKSAVTPKKTAAKIKKAAKPLAVKKEPITPSGAAKARPRARERARERVRAMA